MADLDQVRMAYGVQEWAVLGHSWGAELAPRYAITYPELTTSVAYIGGVGAGDDWREAHRAVSAERLGVDLERWRELSARDRTADEEREWALLQWRPDFVPGPNAEAHARALWATRPSGAQINDAAHRLWTARLEDPLLTGAAMLQVPVTMIHGAQDPRPFWAADDLYAALPHVQRTVLDGAGHAPWVECPTQVQRLLLDALAGRPPHLPRPALSNYTE